MKQIAKTVTITIALLLMVSSVYGFQSARSSEKETKDLNDILNGFPADGSADMHKLASDITGLGKKSLVKLCLFLESPEEKDRINAQYALHGLAIHSAQISSEKERFLVSKSLIKALKLLKEKQAKAFIISQLQLFGKREIVSPLTSYLFNPKLCEPAARALLSLKSKKAEKAFIKSLDSLTGDRRITIIRALGELQSKKAVKKIKPFVSSEDKVLRRVSLSALANIGDPTCLSLLGRMRIRSSAYERSKAPLVYLLYIRRLAESGYKKLGWDICRDLIKNYTAGDEGQIQCGALDLLVEIAGEQALDDLLEAVESPNRAFRKKALDLAVDVYQEDMGEIWIQKIEEVNPEKRTEILDMLGRTGDKSLLDFFRKKLHSEHQVVRMAAVIPLSRWGKEEVINDLFELLQSNREEEIRIVKQALNGFKAESVIPWIRRGFKEMPLNARIALIQVISNKKAFDCADLVLSQIKSSEEDLRRAALSHLERVVDENDVCTIITLLKEAQDPREILWLQKALEKACKFISDPEKRAEKVLAALEEAEGSEKTVFLRPLSETGGNKALEAVLENLEKEDPEISKEAFYTLVQWKSIEAADELLELGKKAQDKKQRYLSLRAYIQLVTSSELDDKNKLDMLMEAKAVPKETDEEKLFLSGLGKIKTLDSMEQAEEFLYNGELRESAARIITQIAMPEPMKRGLSGGRVVCLLEKALSFIKNEREKERILDYIKKLEATDKNSNRF